MSIPTRNDLEHVQNFLSGSETPIAWLEGDIWGLDESPEERSPDLITLQRPETTDSFSRWLTTAASWFLDHKRARRIFRGSMHEGEMVYSKPRLLDFFTKLISVISSQIPIGSIVILYLVKDIRYRFAVISGCALLVTLCLICFTQVRPIDVFLVTAA
jgi:uncharacterized protein DUF6594